jgi:hypothetical protein
MNCRSFQSGVTLLRSKPTETVEAMLSLPAGTLVRDNQTETCLCGRHANSEPFPSTNIRNCETIFVDQQEPSSLKIS